jgi:hypothetical protein
MGTWTQQNLHKHMTVYSSDKQKLGHVANIYEDSFEVKKGFLLGHDSFIPYSEIGQIENNDIILSMPADEATSKLWQKRPDYEDHLYDPTQLVYDRGHNIQDPFDSGATHNDTQAEM